MAGVLFVLMPTVLEFYLMKKWKIIVPLVCLALIGAGVYAAPKAYAAFQDAKEQKRITAEYNSFIESNTVFYDNSYFNGVDISKKDVKEAVAAVEKAFETKSFTLKSEDGQETDVFSYERLDIDCKNLTQEVLNAYEAQTLTRDEYVNGAERKDYSYDISQDVDYSDVDTEGLKCVDEASRVASKDAYISVDRITGALEIVEEVYGNVLKENVLTEKVKTAVSGNLDTVSFVAADYELPSVLATDEKLNDTEAYYKHLLNKSLDLNICGVSINLTPAQVRELLDFEPGNEVDEDAVLAYVRSLKNSYDTYGSTRKFLTSTGEIVDVIAGSYGWTIDGGETAAKIVNALASEEEKESVTGVYTKTGLHPADNEIGDTYVEINLRDQKIYMYYQGVQILNDDITTGMVGEPASITLTGTYSLLYKKTNVTLKGPTWNDFVYYWMPYEVTNAVGMHDATWRSEEEFGGTNRYGNGSHGCVNMRLNSAAIVYTYIEMDTPIIVWEY